MKIVILGAGQVGSTLATNLASEANDVTLIDSREDLLAELRDRLDIQTVSGWGSHPEILEQAGIEDADMLVAVTSHDEINMVACQVAHSLYRTPHKIARIRSSGYTNDRIREKLFGSDDMPVDVTITPEQLVTDHLVQLIHQPGALQVMDFADNRVQLVAVRAQPDAPMVGKQIRDLIDQLGKAKTRVAAIYRHNRPIMAEGDTRIESGDEVFFLASKKHIRNVIAELANKEKPYRRIVIAGGGNIGFRLAQALEYDYQVKLIEMDPKRCEFLAERLHKTIVLNGSSSDQDLLKEESIESVDVFLALTNNDAANIISSMLAKRLQAGKVITLINNPVYADLMQSSGDIDIAVAPSQITTSALLSFVRRGDTVKVHSLRRGAAEAMEIVAHGDSKSSKVVGRRINEVKLPQGATIGGIVRNVDNKPKVLMGHGDVVIEDEDHLIIFLADKDHIRKIEQLFSVSVSFF
jgi:trk system potassium uptake protein TrkA